MTIAEFDYDAKVWGGPKVRLGPTYMQGLKLRYCLEDLEPISGRLLDIGCGAGNMPKAIKHYRPDLDLWGADLSPNALKAANVASEGVKFVASAGGVLPFTDGFFDAVTMFDVLNGSLEGRDEIAHVQNVSHLLPISKYRDLTIEQRRNHEVRNPTLIFHAELTWTVYTGLAKHNRLEPIDAGVIEHIKIQRPL